MIKIKLAIVTPLKSFDTNLVDTAKSIADSSLSSNTKMIDWVIKASFAIDNRDKNTIKEICKNKINVIFYEKNDLTMYEGLIQGIDCIDKEYLIWLNSGDLLFKEALSNIYHEVILKKSSADIYIFNKSVKFKDGKIYSSKRNFFLRFIRRGFYGYYGESLPQENIVFKKSLFDAIDKNLLSKFKLAGDWFIFKELFSQTKNIKNINKKFAIFVYCDGQLSSNKDDYLGEIKNAANFKESFILRAFFNIEKYLGRI